MPAGRPREHNREQIALNLLEWAKQGDSLNLNKFCALNDLMPSQISIWASQCYEFKKAYEKAKAYLGYRREEKLKSGELHVKAYDLNAHTYDYFLKQEKREQAEFESKLRRQEQPKTTTEQDQKFDSLMNQLLSLQSSSNHVDTKSNKEDKS